MTVIEVDDRFYEFALDTAPTILAEGFGTTEGPVWDHANDRLLFNDVPGDTAYAWDAADGVRVLRRPSYKANGATFDVDGSLLVCEHSTSLLVRIADDGSRTVVASHYEGRELNSPNDVVVRSDGTIYFTDPPFGRWDDYYGAKRPRDLDFQAAYCLTRDGRLTIVADDFETPNGLCFSPDETALYVNDTFRMEIRAYDVDESGTTSNERVFFTMEDRWDLDKHGHPDGMKVDVRGNVFCSGPGGIWLIDPSGTHLGIIIVPDRAVNFTFGGEDMSALYITSANGEVAPGMDRGAVCRVQTLTRGASRPRRDDDGTSPPTRRLI